MFALGKLELSRASTAIGLMAVLCVSTQCGAAELSANHNSANGNNASKSDEVLYHLDLRKPTVKQAISRDEHEVEQAKFVRVEVIEVENAKKYALKFEVQYERSNGDKLHLGTFSLFPADNPGNFLVPTKGLVEPEGNIILTMSTPDDVDSDAVIKVSIKKLKFVKQ